jgi:hypothetical protein
MAFPPALPFLLEASVRGLGAKGKAVLSLAQCRVESSTQVHDLAGRSPLCCFDLLAALASHGSGNLFRLHHMVVMTASVDGSSMRPEIRCDEI